MNVQPVRSDATYRAILATSPDKRDNLYRYELMAPFKEKWDCYRVPLKAAEPGGYDVVMASEMLGILPPAQVDESRAEAVRLLGGDAFWDACRRAVERSLSRFAMRGIELPRQDYRFTVLLANPGHPVVRASEGYCGDGGIPGSILAWLDPNESTMRRLPAALAHEANHNVRFQFVKWRDDITLGEMLVSEGLAENFAVELFGEELAGPWVARTTPDLLEQVKPLVHTGLGGARPGRAFRLPLRRRDGRAHGLPHARRPLLRRLRLRIPPGEALPRRDGGRHRGGHPPARRRHPRRRPRLLGVSQAGCRAYSPPKGSTLRPRVRNGGKSS